MGRAAAGLCLVLAAVLPVGGALAAPPVAVTRIAKPSFPPPLTQVVRSGPVRLAAVSTASRAPTYTPRPLAPVPASAPGTLGGAAQVNAFRQPGTTFVVYGSSIVAGIGPRGRVKYAFDLRSFGFPPRSIAPNAYGPQEVVWARQVGRTLVVQTAHLGYATDSGGRNGYLTGIDLDTGRVTWRSPALVANAQSFVVTRGVIVSGYGFTAERDWLYLVDPSSGRVRDRLGLPSAAERIVVRGDRLVVRCYDALVVARLVHA